MNKLNKNFICKQKNSEVTKLYLFKFIKKEHPI